MKSAASIRAKLLNISREEKITFQQILFRFFHERFLARLSVSPYKNSLLLKALFKKFVAFILMTTLVLIKIQ